MTVTISKPAVNIREQLTELKAQQGYEERQFHFDGLVTNGTFDTDTDWTKGTGWTINTTTGVASHAATGAGYLDQTLSTITGQTYVLTYDVTYTSGPGSFQPLIGGTAGTAIASTGTYSETFVATGVSTLFRMYAGASVVGSIDNVSVYEVDPNDSNKVIHTMPKGWKPLHVFEDGALQREGSAYDYTVEYDGFNYIVKETVAPVAPYSTTVIGVRA